MGESRGGQEIIDISTTPHILIGGGTGSGKSLLLKLMLYQSYFKGAKITLADFKGGVDYPSVWHDKLNIIDDPLLLNEKLEEMLQVLEGRKKLLIDSSTSNIWEYNKQADKPLERIIVACDEIAEVLDKTGLGKEEKQLVLSIESKISTIARLGRAFGIHLILATQRPDADVIKGQIKNNLGFRICGKADKVLSQIILDNQEGAEIPQSSKGFFATNYGTKFQAYYLDEALIEYIK